MNHLIYELAFVVTHMELDIIRPVGNKSPDRNTIKSSSSISIKTVLVRHLVQFQPFLGPRDGQKVYNWEVFNHDYETSFRE
jgi:hypothetical protein